MIKTKQEILKYLEKKEDDEIFDITKKQIKTIRSLALNKYWWSVVIDIVSDFMWEAPISAHIALKSLFKLDTSTDLSNEEFIFLIKSTIALFEETYSVKIPLPENRAENESLIKSLNLN